MLSPRITGVSYSGNLYAFIKFTRVRYSFAEYTPCRFSPGIFRKEGSPAPVATNAASNLLITISKSFRKSHNPVIYKLNTHCCERIYFVAYNLLGKPELGNSINQNSAGGMQRLINCNAVSCLCTFTGNRKSRRP